MQNFLGPRGVKYLNTGLPVVHTDHTASYCSVASIVTTLRAGQLGVRIPVGARDLSSPKRPDRLIFNGYQGCLPGGEAAGA